MTQLSNWFLLKSSQEQPLIFGVNPMDKRFGLLISEMSSILLLNSVMSKAPNNKLVTNKRVCPIFQPQRCTLTAPNTGAKHKYLVGHGSNNPRFLHAEFTPVEVAGMLVCLVDRSGPAFTAAT